jgi:hypothetical protein
MGITKIQLDHDLKDYQLIDSDKNLVNIVPDIRKVNFFIGPNNSGKSRMMRTLFWGKHISYIKNQDTVTFENYLLDIIDLLEKYKIDKVDKLSKENIVNFCSGIAVTFDKCTVGFLQEMMTVLSVSLNNRTSVIILEGGGNLHNAAKPLFVNEWNALNANLNQFNTLLTTKLTTNSFGSLYIPILRGARPIAGNTNSDVYVDRSQKDYFNGMGENIKKVFAGYTLYKEVEDLLLGNEINRDLIRGYEDFLSEFFFQKKVTIIPKRGEDVLLIKIGDEDERLIHDLGDGIQSIIILTFPIFIRKNEEHIFYIEEPELNLHPSLQRKLLRSLIDNFPNHQYFFSTHSNHFLEAISETNDVALFSFKQSFKTKKFHIQKLTSIKTDILDNLGVRNSSVLMANCTIWVEGITDRLYISKYLEAYFKYKTKTTTNQNFPLFKEDQHYAFVEYAGSNIVHWTFDENADENINAAYVSNNILLIADSDHGSSGKIPESKNKRFKKLSSALGKNFILIEGKEIENILHHNTILKVVADYEKKDVDFTKAKKIYKRTNLGKWINNSIAPISRDYSKGNTISDKLNFCRKAIVHINDYDDDLTKEARMLCQKIYTFIKENNEEYIDKK